MFNRSVRAADVTGTVLLPDGRPAAGAQVALAVASYPLRLGHAAMSANGGESSVVVAEQDGRFSITPQADKWAVVAMNEAGCAQVEQPDFTNGATITLQPWCGSRASCASAPDRNELKQVGCRGRPAGAVFV